MKCPTCPVTGPEASACTSGRAHTCLGERVTRLCQLASIRADYADRLRILAGDEVDPEHLASNGQTSLRQPSSVVRESRPVRVGFWSPVLYAAGGTEVWHETLLAYLDRDRIDVCGLAVLDGCIDSDMADRIRRYAPVTTGRNALQVLASAVDVLIVWGLARPGEYLAAAETRPQLVMVSHGDTGSTWTVDIMAASEPDVDQYVAVAPVAVATIPESRRAGSIVIRNGISPRRIRPRRTRAEVRAAWGVPQCAKVLIQVARLSAEKDPFALARAVSALPPRWVGVAQGDGVHADRVRAEAERIAPGRVIFAGVATDVGSAYNAADCVLAASRTEGFGLSMAEAAMSGLPVVATRVGLADEVPDAFTLVPIDADGPTLAAAVLGGWPACPGLLERYSAERFGEDWSEFLVDLGVRGRIAAGGTAGRLRRRPG